MDFLAALRQNRVLLFNAYLSSIDEDLSPLGNILVDFGLKKLLDLDVLTTVEIETIIAAFENAQVPPFPRNRLRADLEERKTTAMKLKKSLGHRTAVAKAVDPRVDLDMELVPKSSGGFQSASASSSSASSAYASRGRLSRRPARDDLYEESSSKSSVSSGCSGDEISVRRMATARPHSRRSSGQTTASVSSELRGSKAITSFYPRSEAPGVFHGIGERKSMESSESGRGRLLSGMISRGFGAKCLVCCTGARENRVCICDSQQAARCGGDWGCATRLEKLAEVAVIALRSAAELAVAPANAIK